MINSINNLGKWLFILPFAVFGVIHFINADQMSGMVPLAGGAIWVYITGLAELAFAISVVIGKWDKLAAMLCALMLFMYVILIHAPGIGLYETAVPNLLKDLGLSGGALMYAKSFARDNSIVG
jgi:putative oxidoreductase